MPTPLPFFLALLFWFFCHTRHTMVIPPKTCPTPAFLAHCSIPLHVVVTRGEMLCPKPCQSQRANGWSIMQVVAQLC